MRRSLQTTLTWVTAFGIEPAKTLAAIKNLPITVKEHFELRRQNSELRDPWRIDLRCPNLSDRDEPGGVASGHYFHQDLLVARKIFHHEPEKHVDIGSRIDGFVAHVAVFREIEVLDIRPVAAKVENITFRQIDIMKSADDLKDYSDSISCLHALEHFGLGRYGDALDADGYVKGFERVQQMLRRGGILYLSVPIGEERIEFNAQRIFSIGRIFRLFEDRFSLASFSYVDDAGDLHQDVSITEHELENNFGLLYGCGIFELRKEV